MNPLKPGVIVAGRYRVVEVLGRGGQGSVVRAVDEELHRDVALKVMGDDERGHRARREGRALAAVRSPHVVGVYDVRDASGAEPGLLVLEFVAGTSLRALLDERSLTVDEVIAVGVGVVLGLEAAAAAGVHHRDIKPDNIMVRAPVDGPIASSSICLVDFGLAMQRGDPSRDSVIFAGSPAWLAPERANGDASVIDATAADVYSLGVVLLEALIGANPFAAPTVAQTLLRHERDVPPSATLGRAPGEVKASFADLVANTLDKDPVRRPTLAATRMALLEIGQERATPASSSSSSSSSSLPSAPATPARRAPIALGLGATIAVLVGAVAWLAVPGGAVMSAPDAGPIEAAPPPQVVAAPPPPAPSPAPTPPPAPAPTVTSTPTPPPAAKATAPSSTPVAAQRVLPTPWPVGLAARRRLLAEACADLPCAAASSAPVPDDLTALAAHKADVDACLARCAAP